MMGIVGTDIGKEPEHAVKTIDNSMMNEAVVNKFLIFSLPCLF